VIDIEFGKSITDTQIKLGGSVDGTLVVKKTKKMLIFLIIKITALAY
jgi:hypothetical protein